MNTLSLGLGCILLPSLSTGNEVVDQVLRVLLSTGMFVGCLTGFVLDNLLLGQRV